MTVTATALAGGRERLEGKGREGWKGRGRVERDKRWSAIEEEGGGRWMLRAEKRGACGVCAGKLSDASAACQGMTAFAQACSGGHEEAARALIEMGADVNAKDHNVSAAIGV